MENLDALTVEDVRVNSKGEGKGQGQDGYGRKIHTRWELKIGGHWYRVYVCQFSNTGSAYIVRSGKNVYLGAFEPGDWKPKGITELAPLSEAIRAFGENRRAVEKHHVSSINKFDGHRQGQCQHLNCRAVPHNIAMTCDCTGQLHVISRTADEEGIIENKLECPICHRVATAWGGTPISVE